MSGMVFVLSEHEDTIYKTLNYFLVSLPSFATRSERTIRILDNPGY